MFYEIRIEPKQELSDEWIKRIISEAFKVYGGLSVEGVEIINKD